MGKPIEVTDDTFEKEIIHSDKPAVVDFWAVWCGPCKIIAPIMEDFADDYEGKVKIAKLDVDNNPNVAIKFGIRSIPTVLFFKEGKIVDQIIGALPRSKFEEKIKELV
jgi:thioredoxin 1